MAQNKSDDEILDIAGHAKRAYCLSDCDRLLMAAELVADLRPDLAEALERETNRHGRPGDSGSMGNTIFSA